MKYTKIGTSKVQVSQIGLGTMQFGSQRWGFGKEFDREDISKIIKKGIESGVNLIDTAEIYARGKSEKLIGEAIKGYDRENLRITTKFMPFRLRPSSVKKALLKSLDRLQTSYVDIYLIHFPNPLISIGRVLQYMEEMVDEGLIRHIGVSNFSKNRFDHFQKRMKNYRIQVNQVNYSIVKHGAENSFLPYANENQIMTMAYSPLAQGFLSGKYSADNRPKGSRRMNRVFRQRNLERGTDLLSVLRELAKKYDVTMSQIALRYLIDNESVVVIPGAKSQDQAASNAEAAGFDLQQEDIFAIREAAMNFKPSLIF
ncbi:MAG: aldo/keto reductase [Candidatus Thorarchaeota archaeon]